MPKVDWRSDIAGLSSLDDCDPVELMIYLRHQFLLSAKDLVKSKHEDEVDFAKQCSMTAENLQKAIEVMYGVDPYV
jgi:hypothetical protein